MDKCIVVTKVIGENLSSDKAYKRFCQLYQRFFVCKNCEEISYGGSIGHPKSCSQIINYISAHDNFNLWDKLVMSVHGGHAVNSELTYKGENVYNKAIIV